MSPGSLDVVWGVKKNVRRRSQDRVPAGPNQIKKLENPCQDTSDAEPRPVAKAKLYATFRPRWPSGQFCCGFCTGEFEAVCFNQLFWEKAVNHRRVPRELVGFCPPEAIWLLLWCGFFGE